MCWTLTASLIFICVFIGAALIVWYSNSKRRKTFIIFILYFCGMEILQAMQWYFGDVVGEFPDVSKCSGINRTFTYVAFLYVFFQPVLFSLVGGFSYCWNRVWITITALNMVVFVTNFITLVVATQISPECAYSAITGGTFTNVTCTVIGPNHKLVWLFKAIDINYTVTFQVYLWLSILPFLFYNFDLISVPVAWVFTLLVSIFVFQTTSVELPSFWCLLSVISVVVIMIQIVVEKHYYKQIKQYFKGTPKLNKTKQPNSNKKWKKN